VSNDAPVLEYHSGDTSQIGIQYVEVLRYEDANPGESYLGIEAPVNGVFSGKGDNEPASGIRIEETRYSYATDFTVSWESDSSFIAHWASPQSDTFNIARVNLTNDGYTISCGSVHLDCDDSYLSGFEIAANSSEMLTGIKVFVRGMQRKIQKNINAQ